MARQKENNSSIHRCVHQPCPNWQPVKVGQVVRQFDCNTTCNTTIIVKLGVKGVKHLLEMKL